MKKIKVYKTVLNERKQLQLAETGVSYNVANPEIDHPNVVATFLTDVLELTTAADEYFYVFCLNTKNRLIGIFDVSHGGNASTIVPVREVFQKALLLGASRIIMAHNHPSGYTDPSDRDIEVTKQIASAGELIDVVLLDHIIVGSESPYFSFAENEEIKNEF